jgi:hypothetical protein
MLDSEPWIAGVPFIVRPYGAPAVCVAQSGAGVVVMEYSVASFLAARLGTAGESGPSRPVQARSGSDISAARLR